VKKLLALAVFVGLGFLGLAQTPVAVVNGEPITKEELDNAAQLNQILFTLYYQYPRFAQTILNTPEGKALLTRYQRDVLEDLILRKIQIQEARARGITADPARVNELLDQMLEQIKSYYGLSDEELAAELEKEGLTVEQFRSELQPQAEEQALLEALKAAVTAGITVSEDEISAYYTANPGQFVDAQGNNLPLEQVHDKIASLLASQKQETAWQEWLKQARESANVQINL
jgi:parvulin-like peptidyl-prolyl isomerase